MPKEKNSNTKADTNSSVLPRSIYVPQEDPRSYMRETVDSIFSDRFMAFLALLLVPIIILEFLVPLSPAEYEFLEICDWMIIVLFIIEYVSKLYLAKDRWAYFRVPWHLLDLVIVVTPFVQFLPFLGLKLTGSASLLLRLLRLPRAFAAAGRATSARERKATTPVAATSASKAIIRKVDPSSIFLAPRVSRAPGYITLTWEELDIELADQRNEAWIDISNVSDEDFSRLSRIMQISEPHFKSGMIDEIYPHIDYLREASFVFLQSGQIRYPENQKNYLTISRSGFILVCDGTKLVSISKHDVDLFDWVSRADLEELKRVGASFLVSVLYAVLDGLLNEYRSLLSDLEIDVIKIGNIPRSKLPRNFLQRIYQLTKEVSRLDSNLVRLKDLIGDVTSRQVSLSGFGKESEEAFQLLQDRASYMKEVSDDLVTNLKSIIELYINEESFETNRTLKILAVITSVAVIPATVSGVLGMNVAGTPVSASLWEVSFMIAITVSFLIYAFIKLGWLKV